MRTAVPVWLLPVLASVLPHATAQSATYSETTIVQSTGDGSSTSGTAGSDSTSSDAASATTTASDAADAASSTATASATSVSVSSGAASGSSGSGSVSSGAASATASASSSSSVTYSFSPTSTPSGSGSFSFPGLTSFSGGVPPQVTAMPPQALPASTDAAAYLAHVFPATVPQPTWATGRYYTELASALYAVDRSFDGRADFPTIVAAIYSAGEGAGGPAVSASLAASAFGWGQVATNVWYQTAVPAPYRDEVAAYVTAWHAAENRVLRASTSGDGDGGSDDGDEDTAPRAGSGAAVVGGCGAVVVAGIVAGFVGFLGLA